MPLEVVRKGGDTLLDRLWMPGEQIRNHASLSGVYGSLSHALRRREPRWVFRETTYPAHDLTPQGQGMNAIFDAVGGGGLSPNNGILRAWRGANKVGISA